MMTRRTLYLSGWLALSAVLLAFCHGCTSDAAPAPHAAKPMDAHQVAFLGDSITARWQPLPVAGAINAGISGQTSEQVAARMQADVIDAGAGVVVILAGTNDILKQPTADTSYVQSVALQARDAGLRVILATIPPTLQGEGDSMARVDAFNAELVAWAQDNHFELVDYYGALVADYPADTVDGIHPNAAGYALMWAQLQPHLAE